MEGFINPSNYYVLIFNMALQGQVEIEGRKYGILSCSYSFSQDSDNTGVPTSRIRGGEIRFTMPSTSDDDLFFYNWMFSKTKVFSGTFKFCVYTNDNHMRYKTVTFVNAFCSGLNDEFDNNNSKLMLTSVTIKAEIIKIGNKFIQGTYFSNKWTSIDEEQDI